MKTQILIAVFLGLTLGACSSSKKNAEESATEKVEQAAEGAKETAKDAKDAAKAALDGEVTCTSGKDVRTIGVKALESGGCEVMYTKFGEATSVASGSKGSDHCSSVVTKIKDNLQNAGFKCE